MKYYDVCVVGGGLAGLSAAYYLLKHGITNTILFEASRSVGGLLRSTVINGYTFDVGGSHIIFSKNSDILREILNILNGNYVRHRRNSKIFIEGRYVKYPFENGLKDLPPEKRFECLRDIINIYIKRLKGEVKEPKNFLEWLYYVFGKCIVNTYLKPYNEKLWKIDLSEVTLEWVQGRVPTPPIEDVMKAAVGLDTEGYKHQLNFYYPLRGGIESLIKSLINEVNERIVIKAESKVRKVSLDGEDVIVEVSDDEVKCGYVVYTAPLNESADILKGVLGDMSGKLSMLRSVPLVVASIGFRGSSPPYHWVYVPQKDIVFHRFAFLSNYSPYNAPKNHTALITETSLSNQDELRSLNEYTFLRRVIEGLEYLGIIKSEKDVEVYNITKWVNAYVVYDKIRSEVLSKVKSKLLKYKIILHGRFGLWEYLNMDTVLSKSQNVAGFISSKLE